MVTLRRDIAAQKGSSSIALTDYDRHMFNKNNDKNLERSGFYKTYSEYLCEQLNRGSQHSRSTILTENEYNRIHIQPLQQNAKPVINTTKGKKLSKFGKIILSIYVLITIAIASIIVVTNNDTDSVNDKTPVSVESIIGE